MAGSNQTLQIKMFGKFSMKNGNYAFPQEKKKSKQVGLLFAYLLANRNVETSKSKLIEVLWPEEDSGNPEGALRNLVYRGRMEMKKFFVRNGQEAIVLNNNSYFWNTDISCQVDTDQFEAFCKQVSVGHDAEQKYQDCLRAVELYQGDFLEGHEDSQWVIFRSVYYKRLYTTCVQEACEALLKAERYQQVVELCDQAKLMEQMDLRVHEMKMAAYLKLNQPQNALDYYNQVANLCYSNLGMEVPDHLKELYELILQSLPTQKPVDVEELEKGLREEKLSSGTFYCNYDIFKNIYQINVRAARRALRSRFLVLLTLRESGTQEHIDDETETLRQVISEQLRKNDVFSQYNVAQYSVILAAQNIEGCEKAMRRIMDKYCQRRKFDTVTLEYEIKQIK